MPSSIAPWISAMTLTLVLPLTACKEEPADDDTGEPEAVEPPRFKITRAAQELTDLATEAVGVAPAWLRDDLEVALGRMEEESQDEFAALLIDLDDPYLVDEVAFTIAHVSTEVLESAGFYPELLTVNAEYVYRADAQLEYVELVEVGEPGVDDDFYTTAAYRVETADGSVVERTVDRDIYYWYVVHPRLEDEPPYFIDGWSSGYAASPDDGWFWRGFLWEQALEECPEDRECPVLDGWFTDTDVLWKSREGSAEDNGAMGRLVQYVREVLAWGAGDERPVQPVRIYAVACGNCGEHADMSCAAARTALVPCQNVGARSNDHTWNEFWDEGWHGWEPVNSSIDYMGYYSGGVDRDLVDNDCDGTTDYADDPVDHDGDGYAGMDGDCDDTDAAVHPGATEVQNGRDDDCDGVADPGFVDSDLDGDGDGFSISDGDCADADAARYPGATEDPANLVDDDCDGVADDGLDDTDADGDGFSILAGDCDDTDAAVHPDATETGNGIDDDCDGVADAGLDDHDRDGDGFTMADGDCNDLSGGVHPDAQDPGLSSNRLYTITAARGDTYITTDRTVDYGTEHVSFEFTITDGDGVPVDGAVVTLYGTWEVYGYPDYWNWSAEVVTDLDGRASAIAGEANPYGYSVASRVGDEPGGNYLLAWLDWTVAGETYTLVEEVGEMPAGLAIAEADLTGGEPADVSLTYAFVVDSYRVEADGAYSGSMSVTHEGGRVDAFVVNDENFQLFHDGEAFEAMALESDASSGGTTLDLPMNGSWTLVLANVDTVASTMTGTVELSAEPAAGVSFTADVEPLSARFHIPPGEYMAIALLMP